ncbi:MAG: phospholipase D-like domain-containing protein [Halarcobacter sp.]
MKLKLLFIILLLLSSLNCDDKIYLFPNESKKAIKDIELLIKESKTQIDVAMYNFSKKSLAKLLIKAHENGVLINVFFDSKKIKDKSSEYKLLKKNGINCYIIDDAKLHTKLAIFDKKTALFGSLNWTKDSFSENYEILYITSKKDVLSKLNRFIKNLKDK